jgi:hypothetical protein
MKFWILTFGVDLFMVLIMIVFGRYLIKKAKKFKDPFGYNTGFSIKNKAVWEFANLSIGRSWFIGGLVLAPIVIIIMLYNIPSELYVVARVGGAICSISGLYMSLSTLTTVILLRIKFDKNGNRKNKE